MPTLSDQQLYFALFVVFSIGLCWLLLRALRIGEGTRQKRLFGRKDWLNAVSTDSPLQNPREQASQAAHDSLKKRFSIIRRLLVAVFIVLIFLAALVPYLGTLPTALISLLIAATSVILGIAAKPFLENFIAGIVLTFAKPFRVGDTVFIDDKHYGTVEDITMTYTIIKIWDWRRFVIPNSQMMNKNFINLTLKDRYIWAYVEFWVAPDAEINQVKEVAIEAARNSKAFGDHEEPDFWVMGMEEKSMRCWVAAWVDSPADAWQLCSDIRIELIQKFQILKISPHKVSMDINNLSELQVSAASTLDAQKPQPV